MYPESFIWQAAAFCTALSDITFFCIGFACGHMKRPS